MWTSLIASALTVIGKALGLITQRGAENNSPAMIAAAAANQEQSEKDKSTVAVKTQNTKEVEREISE